MKFLSLITMAGRASAHVSRFCRRCCVGMIPTGYEDETGFHFGIPPAA